MTVLELIEILKKHPPSYSVGIMPPDRSGLREFSVLPDDGEDPVILQCDLD